MAKKKDDSIGKHAGGRPPLFETPEQLLELVESYFSSDDKPTLSGLSFNLGMSRQSLYNYAEKDEFFDIIKKARQRIESVYEKRLIYESNPTGVIFALKNMGWFDKQEIDHTTKGESINKEPTIEELKERIRLKRELKDGK
jgi:hypothetical protein